jgi:CHASE2 domain-containing sensor protein
MDGGSAVPNLVLYFFLPFCGVFTLISGILLGKESKQAWKVTAIILAITIICFLGLSLYSLINAVVYIIPLISLLEGLSCFIPLILIILDRKNYFEMVRQRELEENGNG